MEARVMISREVSSIYLQVSGIIKYLLTFVWSLMSIVVFFNNYSIVNGCTFLPRSVEVFHAAIGDIIQRWPWFLWFFARFLFLFKFVYNFFLVKEKFIEWFWGDLGWKILPSHMETVCRAFRNASCRESKDEGLMIVYAHNWKCWKIWFSRV